MLLHVFRPELVSGACGKQAEAFLNYNLDFRPALVSDDVQSNLAVSCPEAPPERVLLGRAPLALVPSSAAPPVPLLLAGWAAARQLPLAHPGVGGEELIADLATPSTRHARLRRRLRPAATGGLLQVSTPGTRLGERLSLSSLALVWVGTPAAASVMLHPTIAVPPSAP